jgi:mono/diheme cytochrome c family protein
MKTLRPLPVVMLCGSLMLVVGCKEQGSADKQPAPSGQAAQAQAGGGDEITAELKKEAADIFGSRCMPCHGPMGAGDGPASAALTPKPRNFRDPAWQAEVSDEHLEKVISYGGAAVGRSPAMPANPDLADKPVVKALRQHIRGLKQ